MRKHAWLSHPKIWNMTKISSVHTSDALLTCASTAQIADWRHHGLADAYTRVTTPSAYDAQQLSAAMKKAAGKTNFQESIESLERHQTDIFDRMSTDDETVRFDAIVQEYLR